MFRLVKSAGGVVDPAMVEVTGSSVIVAGNIVDMNHISETVGEVVSGTSSSTVLTIFGVAASALSSGTGAVTVIPFMQGQLWEADTANNTAATQVLKRHALSDQSTISNLDPDQSTTSGVFLCYALVGAAADKKMLGEFVRVGNVTA